MQLHPTSLPGGRLGAEALRFVDWLAEAGQSWWQMLPLGPPDRYGSPYKSPSAFAAWPGLLADPAAEVAPEEEAAFRERHAVWIEGWEAYAGHGVVEEQLRVGLVVGAARGDVDRHVADQPHAALGRVGAQRAPLAVEAHLVRDRAPGLRPVADPVRAALAEVQLIVP